MRKPNYRFERAERDRAKKAKTDKKLQRQQERVAPRDEDSASEPTAENEPRESSSTLGSHSDVAALMSRQRFRGRAGRGTNHPLVFP